MSLPFLQDLQQRMAEEAARQAGMASQGAVDAAQAPGASTQDIGARTQDVASYQAATLAETTTKYILKVAIIGGVLVGAGLIALHYYDRK